MRDVGNHTSNLRMIMRARGLDKGSARSFVTPLRTVQSAASRELTSKASTVRKYPYTSTKHQESCHFRVQDGVTHSRSGRPVFGYDNVDLLRYLRLAVADRRHWSIEKTLTGQSVVIQWPCAEKEELHWSGCPVSWAYPLYVRPEICRSALNWNRNWTSECVNARLKIGCIVIFKFRAGMDPIRLLYFSASRKSGLDAELQQRSKTGHDIFFYGYFDET
jgi:hypothetical protein